MSWTRSRRPFSRLADFIVPVVLLVAYLILRSMGLGRSRQLWYVGGIIVGTAYVAVPGFRYWRSRGGAGSERVCQRCGYDLRGLEIPRCPECGTLVGFTKSLDELGVSDKEIREGFERKRRVEPPPPLPEDLSQL